MLKKHISGLIGLVAMIAVAPAALAAASPVTLESVVKLDKTVTENGQTKHVLSDPKKVVPGNHLVFLITYRNSGDKPVQNFVVTNPLPSAVVLGDDGFGSFDVSVDGGKAWGKLVSLKIGDGKGGVRAAQAADATHVRWVIPAIAPGASGTLEYHAVVR